MYDSFPNGHNDKYPSVNDATVQQGGFMSFPINIFLASTLVLSVLSGVAGSASASGMLPETSVVIINEADGEASMNVTNTDATTALLYTSVQNLPEDKESLLVVTPPVARVDAGETQLVRFILQNREPLKTQRFKRVTFEGIPQKSADGGVKVTMTVRQNLPVIIHPKNLEMNRAPWKLLRWSLQDGTLNVNNDSAYVVRLAQMVVLLPNQVDVDLGKTYLLPGEHIAAKASTPGTTAPLTVRLSPATVYGFSVDSFDAPLTAAKP